MIRKKEWEKSFKNVNRREPNEEDYERALSLGLVREESSVSNSNKKTVLVLGTVTQASNLTSDLKKDPNFVMTREFLSEDKGKIRPFDFFFTFNQTYDEMKHRDENGILRPIIRIYLDKLRDYWSGQTVTIVTSFKNSIFYDRKNTIKLILDEEDE